MNELQVFEYRQTMDVRMVMQGDEPWWVLKDVCKVLGLSNSRMVADRLDEDEVSQTYITDSLGRQQETTVINESGLYSVILRSDKPEAKAFKRWVTHEVLPSIRRTGRYELDGQTAPMALQGPGAAPLPLSAQSLWFTLLWLEKEQGGRGEVTISAEKLMALMGIKGRHTLSADRAALVKSGYITHSNGVKDRPCVYKLLQQRAVIQ